jgi:D-alanine-D-alanine ligase-like ATP-grasp enzyme
MQSDTKKRIGILRGGLGKHYASSIKKGGEIILHISENLGDKYKVTDILIDKAGKWHENGKPIKPVDLAHKIDIAWNLAGPEVSVTLGSLAIPNIGQKIFAFQNSKEMLREHIKQIGLLMPQFIISPKNAREVFEKFGAPWIVKFLNEIKIVKTFDELAEMINGKENAIVEEFIGGKIASIHSVPMFRGENIYTFPLGNSFGIFSAEEKDKLTSLAKTLHIHLDAKHYLKSDFLLTPHGKVYLLQIEGIPDLKPGSHFSEVAESVGAKMSDVVEHILEQA